MADRGHRISVALFAAFAAIEAGDRDVYRSMIPGPFRLCTVRTGAPSGCSHRNLCRILCTNRDEYLSRPTVNAHFHSDSGAEAGVNFVLSGRDLQAGDSRFGVNRASRGALLTNNSEHGASYKESRGHLVSSFLLPDAPDREQFVKLLVDDDVEDKYAGLNLLLLSPSGGGERSLTYEASLITNSGGGGTITSRALGAEERRTGGVSNGIDNVNVNGRSWPKVTKGEASLRELLYENQTKAGSLSESEDELAEQLFEILLIQPEQSPANRFQLRTSIQIPPLRMPPSLSPDAEVANRHGWYGTRLSTVLLVRRDGRVVFI